PVGELVDEDVIAGPQRGHHAAARDLERLVHARADRQRDQHGDADVLERVTQRALAGERGVVVEQLVEVLGLVLERGDVLVGSLRSDPFDLGDGRVDLGGDLGVDPRTMLAKDLLGLAAPRLGSGADVAGRARRRAAAGAALDVGSRRAAGDALAGLLPLFSLGRFAVVVGHRALRVQLEDGMKSALRDLHVAHRLESLLALFLLLEQLPLAAGVAAVALGEDVLAQRLDGRAGDDPAADRRLNGDLELLARNFLFHFDAEVAAADERVVAVG